MGVTSRALDSCYFRAKVRRCGGGEEEEGRGQGRAGQDRAIQGMKKTGQEG